MKYRPPRVPKRIPCSISWNGALYPCTVTSINDGGASFSTDPSIGVGQEVVLNLLTGPSKLQ